MNSAWAILLLIGGLVILWKAAELLVSGAVGLATRLGISSLVVGLTVVAMGTSAPEIAASIAAAVRGAGDVAVGNIYGSNIANLALVGGICALIRPIAVRLRTLKREIPIMLIVALLLWPILYNLSLSRFEGAILLIIFVGLITLTVFAAKKEAQEKSDAISYDIGKVEKPALKPLKVSVLFVIIGLLGLAIGADITVRGAVFAGEKIGLSKAVIGLAIIAIGTSLPELATCVAAAVKGHDDISIGTLVGSNVFNTLFAAGMAGVVRPFSIVERLAGTDYWIMVIVSGAFVVMSFTGRKISRANGALLVAGYAAFMVYLLAFSG